MSVTVEDRIQIIDDVIRKKYLNRLSDMDVVPVGDLPSLEEDIIKNTRLYLLEGITYQQGESLSDNFAMALNSLSAYDASAFVLVDSDGEETKFYLGVRNNNPGSLANDGSSTVFLGETLGKTLVGYFPGISVRDVGSLAITMLSKKIEALGCLASVSVTSHRSERPQVADQSVQGLEKLVNSMSGRAFTCILFAESQSSQDVQVLRKQYQDLYTKLSSLRQSQLGEGKTGPLSHNKSFDEVRGKKKASIIAEAASSFSVESGHSGTQLAEFANSLAPVERTSKSILHAPGIIENKQITDMLSLLDVLIGRTYEYESYGLWHVTGYFMSDKITTARIAANNYRSLMFPDDSGQEVAAINSWRRSGRADASDFRSLATYLSRFVHPRFSYGGGIEVDASTSISSKELGMHLVLPSTTVPGFTVVEHAEFGKEVTTYDLTPSPEVVAPEDSIAIGSVFDRGQATRNSVVLGTKSLCRHTFVTGSAGSGKSNAVYQMLTELRRSKVPFLVIEPAKGQYKNAFGNLPDVSVFSTNPDVARLLSLNPFIFPKSIHVLEHVDGLVEVFGVCWPLNDGMRAFLKDAILRSYEVVGWDLGSSTFEGKHLEFPDFDVLAEQLDELILESNYSSHIKSSYHDSLLTRVKSLTVGLNKYIFTLDQTPYEELFDKNCVLDLSRVKSAETTALIMGFVVYMLNEHRVDQGAGNDGELKHVTVIEEAHNLLRNTSDNAFDPADKSMDMITNTITEMGTYGEGFIIVDQSPSLVNSTAIKSARTVVVLRTPEADDRAAIVKCLDLTDAQTKEIANLPNGVAVVCQNDWACPVLTLINKAPVEPKPYKPKDLPRLISQRSARALVVRMLMQPWFGGKPIERVVLLSAQMVLELKRRSRVRIKDLIEDYTTSGGHLSWKEDELYGLSVLLRDVLDITEAQLESATANDELTELVSSRLGDMEQKYLVSVCNILIFDGRAATRLYRFYSNEDYSPLSLSDAESMSGDELRYVNTCIYDPFYSDRDSSMDLIECIGKLRRSDSLKNLLIEYCKTPADARMYLYLEVAYRYFGVLELVRTFDQNVANWDEALMTHVSRKYEFEDDVDRSLNSSEWVRFSQTMLAAGIIWVKDEYNGVDKNKILDALWKQHRADA